MGGEDRGRDQTTGGDGRVPIEGGRRHVRVLVFAASLRDGSLNARLADVAARELEAQGAEVDRASMRSFVTPAYDGDREQEQGVPEGAAELRRRLEAADAFVIASPEYNGAMPGLLKNSIDWASRFRPQPFNGRHCLLMSASPSMMGGNRGLWSLRVPLEHLGTRVYPDMFSLARAHEMLDERPAITSDELQRRLVVELASFLDVVEATKHYPCAKKVWIEFPGEQPTLATSRAE